jgi:hypothetical protein
MSAMQDGLAHVPGGMPSTGHRAAAGWPVERPSWTADDGTPSAPDVAVHVPPHQLETPFLETWFAQPSPSPSPSPVAAVSTVAESPFRTEYYGEDPRDPVSTAASAVLDRLHDPEFDEAVGELVQEAAAQHTIYTRRVEGGGAPPDTTDRLLWEWLDPLRRDAEALVEQFAENARHVDPATVTNTELDAIAAPLGPGPATAGNPVFEQFLDVLKKTVTNFAKGAADLVKKGVAAVGKVLPGLPALLAKLKPLVRPLLDRVLGFAINRLPAQYRRVATTLARKLIGKETAEVFDELEALPGLPATADVAVVQEEFHEQLTGLLFAADEHEQELVLAEAAVEVPVPPGTTPSDLDRARARFVSRLRDLEPGQDPTPAMEEFLPAALAALWPPTKAAFVAVPGLRAAVVDGLAGFLAPLLGRFIGTGPANPLAKAIIDTGFALLALEEPGGRSPQTTVDGLAAATVAATVEDTARGVAQLTDEAVADPLQLQAAMMRSFNRAVSNNFPPGLVRPDLRERESSAPDSQWQDLGVYKKYVPQRTVTVTPALARQVHTFGGVTLESALRTQGVSLPATGPVHVYEAKSGTWLSTISLAEQVLGRDRTERAWNQLHPLTPEAAAALLHDPGLGRAVPARFLVSRNLIEVGQRFYFLQLPRSGPPTCARPSEVNLALDRRVGRDELKLAIYLTETEAQEIANLFHDRKLVSGFDRLREVTWSGVQHAFSEGGRRHVRVLRDGVPEEQLHPLLGRVLQVVLTQAAKKVVDWAAGALSDYVKRRADEFVSVTRDPACGLTLVITLGSSPLWALLDDVWSGKGVDTASVLRAIGKGLTTLPSVTIKPGFTRA